MAGLRARGLAAPDFDRADGGTAARLLILLETPGPRAVEAGFVSLDNPSGTARTLRRLLGEVGIDRREIVLWNAVPQILSAARSVNASAAQVRAAVPDAQALLARLPRLSAALLCGRKAQGLAPQLEWPPGVRVFGSFHPSAQAMIFPERRAHLAATLAEIAGHLARSHPA